MSGRVEGGVDKKTDVYDGGSRRGIAGQHGQKTQGPGRDDYRTDFVVYTNEGACGAALSRARGYSKGGERVHEELRHIVGRRVALHASEYESMCPENIRRRRTGRNWSSQNGLSPPETFTS